MKTNLMDRALHFAPANSTTGGAQSAGAFSGARQLWRIGLVLLAALRGATCAADGAPAAAGASAAWKYDVPILVGNQYEANKPQEFDALYCDAHDRLWVRAALHWPDEQHRRSDYFSPRSAPYTLTSRDKGLTWQLTDEPFPYSVQRSVLSDGTIVELRSNWWERHPIAEKDKLEKQGYEVRLDSRNADFCSIIYDIWMRRSTDGGKTWEVRALHKELPFFAYFVARHCQLTLGDDTILSFHYGKPKIDEPRSAYVLRSQDAGKNWELIRIADGRLSPLYPDGFGETFPVAWPDGRVMSMLRTSLSSDAFVVRSLDRGKTWTTPEITPVKEKHPTLKLLSDGVVVCTYPHRSARPYGVRARFTSDLGKTWSDEVILRDEMQVSDGTAFPLTTELSDGTLFTLVSAKKDFGDAASHDAPRGVAVSLSGTRWTRNYRHAPTLILPRPTKAPAFNWPQAERDPWQNN